MRSSVRRSAWLSVTLASAIVVGACASRSGAPPATTAAAPAPAAAPQADMPPALTAGAAPVAAPAASLEHPSAHPELDEKLRHCPATVDGARTTLRPHKDHVELEVTASPADSVAEIRRRTRHLEEFTRKHGVNTGVFHGAGQGGGWMRNCPVVSEGTLVVGEDVPQGSRIVMRPSGKWTVDTLRAEAQRRLDALPAPAASGAEATGARERARVAQ